MDVSTLIEMLDYAPNHPDAFKFTAESDNGNVTRFNPSVPDFAVEQISCSSETVHLDVVDSASITIVASGNALFNQMPCPIGTVIYASCNEAITIESVNEPVVAYRAFVA